MFLYVHNSQINHWSFCYIYKKISQQKFCRKTTWILYIEWLLGYSIPFLSIEFDSDCFLPMSAKERTKGIRLASFFWFWWWCCLSSASRTFFLNSSPSSPNASCWSNTMSKREIKNLHFNTFLRPGHTFVFLLCNLGLNFLFIHPPYIHTVVAESVNTYQFY